jgi:ABC-2 type transport system ATP-binding protein
MCTLVNRSASHIELTTRQAHAARPDPVLLISSVTKRWPRQQTPVLRDIDLELGAGELAWLTGENGVGKTTLLRIIAGIIAPDTGRIGVCGLEAERGRRAYQQRIGLLTAGNSGLYARMTVRQHLDYWARLALVAPAERSGRVEESIARFTLGELADRRMDRMSMGQRQRVRIAMTFLHRPALILLDEPVNSLDDEGSAVLVGAIEEHRNGGGSALWCSPGGDGPGTRIERRLRLVAGGLESRD